MKLEDHPTVRRIRLKTVAEAGAHTAARATEPLDADWLKHSCYVVTVELWRAKISAGRVVVIGKPAEQRDDRQKKGRRLPQVSPSSLVDGKQLTQSKRQRSDDRRLFA